MKKILLLITLVVLTGCIGAGEDLPNAQEIVDRSIDASGGGRYANSKISFSFRNRRYEMEPANTGRILRRITRTDTTLVTDILSGSEFERKADGKRLPVPDTMATRYANSVNSVHYFAYLPYGLNDRAVNKKYLDTVSLEGRSYYKVEITFDKEGGGKDFEDTYVYWFNTSTYKPDFLAYDYNVDGGGVRFRKAFNERYINGIRFVDYENYSFEKRVKPAKMDSLYRRGLLSLESKIELKDIQVSPDSGN